MDLQCLQDHMRGQKFLVEGNVYTVDQDGIARGIKEADAAELLKMPASWRKPRTPVAAKGKEADVTIPSMESAVIAAEQRKMADTPAAPEAEEWPDPDDSMELDYLQKMADAYEVKYDAKTTKKTLVKRIREAMYE